MAKTANAPIPRQEAGQNVARIVGTDGDTGDGDHARRSTANRIGTTTRMTLGAELRHRSTAMIP